jgi:hypothetical protein
MIIKHEELIHAVQPFPNRVTAVIVEGCFLGTAPDTYKENWIFNSAVRYAVLEVLNAEERHEAPFIKVVGYETFWFNN